MGEDTLIDVTQAGADLVDVTELALGLTLGCCWGHAVCDQVGGALVEVKAQLVVDITVER